MNISSQFKILTNKLGDLSIPILYLGVFITIVGFSLTINKIVKNKCDVPIGKIYFTQSYIDTMNLNVNHVIFYTFKYEDNIDFGILSRDVIHYSDSNDVKIDNPTSINVSSVKYIEYNPCDCFDATNEELLHSGIPNKRVY